MMDEEEGQAADPARDEEAAREEESAREAENRLVEKNRRFRQTCQRYSRMLTRFGR